MGAAMNISKLLKWLVALGVYPPKSSGGGGSGWSSPIDFAVPAASVEVLAEGIPPNAQEVVYIFDVVRTAGVNPGPRIYPVVDGVVPAPATVEVAMSSVTVGNASGGGIQSDFVCGLASGTKILGEIRFTRASGTLWSVNTRVSSPGFEQTVGSGVLRLGGNFTGIRINAPTGADFTSGTITLRWRE